MLYSLETQFIVTDLQLADICYIHIKAIIKLEMVLSSLREDINILYTNINFNSVNIFWPVQLDVIKWQYSLIATLGPWSIDSSIGWIFFDRWFTRSGFISIPRLTSWSIECTAFSMHRSTFCYSILPFLKWSVHWNDHNSWEFSHSEKR